MPRFFMTLSLNDVSAERIEGYVLIPIVARDYDPDFWSWSSAYTELPTGQSEFRIELNDLGVATESRVYYVPERREFRLCADRIYRLGPDYEGCLLQITKRSHGSYSSAVFCPGDDAYDSLQVHVRYGVRGGTKDWGYA